MVLGEGARRRGAEAHHIDRSTPGVGFAVAEDGQVVRFRAAYVTDALIRLIASTHPAPRQQPIVDTRAGRRSRSAPAVPAAVGRRTQHDQLEADRLVQFLRMEYRAIVVQELDVNWRCPSWTAHKRVRRRESSQRRRCVPDAR